MGVQLLVGGRCVISKNETTTLGYRVLITLSSPPAPFPYMVTIDKCITESREDGPYKIFVTLSQC